MRTEEGQTKPPHTHTHTALQPAHAKACSWASRAALAGSAAALQSRALYCFMCMRPRDTGAACRPARVSRRQGCLTRKSTATLPGPVQLLAVMCVQLGRLHHCAGSQAPSAVSAGGWGV